MPTVNTCVPVPIVPEVMALRSFAAVEVMSLQFEVERVKALRGASSREKL